MIIPIILNFIVGIPTTYGVHDVNVQQKRNSYMHMHISYELRIHAGIPISTAEKKTHIIPVKTQLAKMLNPLPAGQM